MLSIFKNDWPSDLSELAMTSFCSYTYEAHVVSENVWEQNPNFGSPLPRRHLYLAWDLSLYSRTPELFILPFIKCN